MKMQPDRLEGVNVIARQEPGKIWVNHQAYTHSILVPHRGSVHAWSASSFETLDSAAFAAIVALNPELVILGTGSRLKFPAAALWRELMARNIGFEAMDTAAASRTYNVLASEGRVVLAALLMENNGLAA